MNLCSGSHRRGHDEVCYEGKYCPVCEALDSIESLQDQIHAMERDAQDPIIAASKLKGEEA